MNTFSGLLSSFVHQKDISVYPMTRYCGVDRTLMYKYLNGKDYPKEQAVVERMGDFMRLSPSEYEDLLTAWKIEKIGWKKLEQPAECGRFPAEFSGRLTIVGESLSDRLRLRAGHISGLPCASHAHGAKPCGQPDHRG